MLGTCKPSEIFREYFGDICEAIEAKPLPIVNRLYSAKLISFDFKEAVQSMSCDPYEKADKVVKELQQQVEEKGIVFLKAICNFLLNEKHMLKNVGVKMEPQLESEIIFYNSMDYVIKVYNFDYSFSILHNVNAYLMMFYSSN